MWQSAFASKYANESLNHQDIPPEVQTTSQWTRAEMVSLIVEHSAIGEIALQAACADHCGTDWHQHRSERPTKQLSEVAWVLSAPSAQLSFPAQ